KKLTVIEGSYSLHPHFGDYADLKVFLKISPELRGERILARPAFLHERFFNEWIPMEQLYFDTFSVASRCDLVLDAEILCKNS
ncbi:MAG: uridine kinase, partial [Oscillospiraceae bacterium]|nr:uridine kinase [Oscillospiraceae bacterium]